MNPDNRCFYGSPDGICLPSAFSDCDPTAANSCTGAFCLRGGYDNVGSCEETCTYGSMCTADAQGQPRSCVFFNQRVDRQGNPTVDVDMGLVCLPNSTQLPPGFMCQYINECVDGYECDIFSTNGAATCAKMCRNGFPEDCPTGTCQDAFLIGISSGGFVTGDIGLCR